MIDAEVPAWWQRLRLPGLIDIHTHFMPKPVMDAVWRYFENAQEHYGTAWPVHYRGTDEERVAQLRALGVRRFTALVYPHKPGMAESLNEWARTFAAGVPECAVTGTFYPEPGAAGYVRAALDAGTRVFKVHVQVGEFDPRDGELRRGVGDARRGRCACRRALRQRAAARQAHRTRPVR